MEGKRYNRYMCFIVLLISMLFMVDNNANVYAEEEIIASGTCGEKALWKITKEGNLVIYGEGDMTNYSSYESIPYYNYKSYIKNLVIEEGITSIGEKCFNGLNIENATISDGVTKINSYAFYSCSLLKCITMSNTIIEIDNHAFSDCSSLEKVVLPNYVTIIRPYTFTNCLKLNDIQLPEQLESIQYNAFENCICLERIDIPESVKSISEKAFNMCTMLSTVNMSNNLLDTIKNNKEKYFYGTKWLVDQGLVKGSVGENVLWELTSNGVLNIKGKGKMISNLDSTQIPWRDYTNLICSVTMDDEITDICNYAFYNCKNLTELKLSSKIEDIGEEAFGYCESLNRIYLPENLKKISGGCVFLYCKNLSDIYIQSNKLLVKETTFIYIFSNNSVKIYYPEKNWEGIGALSQYGVTGLDDLELIPYQSMINHQIDEKASSHFAATILKDKKDPDCETDGYTGDVCCSVCGSIVESGKSIPAMGHKWGTAVVTKYPTTTEKGIKTYTCTLCLKTKTEEIPVVESDTTSVPAVKTKDNKTTFSIKNKAKIKKTAKIKVNDKDKIKKITLNGKSVKIKKNKTSITIKLKSCKKMLKKKGKWNKLVVVDKLGNKKTLKFKTK